jgi:hypothetical protein
MSVTIQLRNGTAAQWTTANPVLAAGEMGVETDTRRFKFGNGVGAWNSLPYAGQFSLAAATDVLFSDTPEPVTPAAGTAELYFRRMAGRMRLFVKGPSGLATMLGIDRSSNFVFEIKPAASATLTSVGGALANSGTISHPAATEQYGHMINFATAATANSVAGSSNSTSSFFRGSVAGANGFEFSSRLAFSDASYNESGVTTGSRIFIGLSDQVFASAVVNADAPTAGNYCGFRRNHVNAGQLHTNWQFVTRDGVTISTVDTGVPFLTGKVYDFRIFCGPQSNAIGWTIINLTNNTETSGTVVTNLPTAAAAMRPGFQMLTINAVIRNVRLQTLTCESER